jgi:integrase
MIGMFRRGKTWWFSLQVGGKQKKYSSGTDNKKLAEDIVAKIRVSRIEGTWFDLERSQKAKKITFRELTEKYLRSYEKSRDVHTLKKLLPVFGDLKLSEIETEMICDYRTERLLTVKPATVYQELSLMRRIFNVPRKEWKWKIENPVAGLSFSVGRSNARIRWLAEEEENLVISNATNPIWLRPFVIVAFQTGMRKGEILYLEWPDIDFRRRQITVQKSKNGTKRGIPMSEMVVGALKAIRVRDISGRVFPISDWSLRNAFGKTMKKAGITDFRIHDMRHTFATRLIQNGVDLYTVQKLLGHERIEMTQRYAHHCAETLRPAIAVLDKLSQFHHNQRILEENGAVQNS